MRPASGLGAVARLIVEHEFSFVRVEFQVQILFGNRCCQFFPFGVHTTSAVPSTVAFDADTAPSVAP